MALHWRPWDQAVHRSIAACASRLQPEVLFGDRRCPPEIAVGGTFSEMQYCLKLLSVNTVQDALKSLRSGGRFGLAKRAQRRSSVRNAAAHRAP